MLIAAWNNAALNELAFPGEIRHGQYNNADVLRYQELSTLAGVGLEIDGDFGDGTLGGVEELQGKHQIEVTGVIDEATWNVVTADLRAAFSMPGVVGATLPETFAIVLEQHYRLRPREVGGNNSGPWVRAYMRGHDNRNRTNPKEDWNWCMGAMTTILLQAAEAMGVVCPFGWEDNCNDMRDAAMKMGRFIAGYRIKAGRPPAIFLRKKPVEPAAGERQRYQHTGGVIRFDAKSCQTREGNFGPSGAGYLGAYSRGYVMNDFIDIEAA